MVRSRKPLLDSLLSRKFESYRASKRRFAIESLEARHLMAAQIGIIPGVPSNYQFAEPETDTQANGGAQIAFTTPLNQTFFLHSRPSATKTIYLDFNGHTTSGTLWNSQYNSNLPFTQTAYSIDSDIANFSNTELQRIQDIFLQVSEDFAPFDVNVTTQEPADLGDLMKTGPTDTRWGIRAVIGSTFAPFSNAGGVAYLTSFNFSTDTPALVFEDNLGNGNAKFTAEATTHEVGHSLGLNHDGRSTPSEAYYQGHGSGGTSWAPIMGVGYSVNVVQWSMGQYLNANNLEDDLSIITTQNGFGYRPDDHPSTLATALPIAGSGATTFTIAQNGVIEQSSDFDYFRINAAAGVINLSIAGAPISPNLDVLAELYNSNGVLVASSNPVNALNATINYTAAAGTYYLKIDGTGVGDPSMTPVSGYTDYASLGEFRITGSFTIAPTNSAPVLNDQRLANLRENPTASQVVGNVVATDPNAGQTLTYSILSGNTGGAFAINASTGQITVANPAVIDFETNPQFQLQVQVADNGTPSMTDTGIVTIRLENQLEATPSSLQLMVPLYQYPLSAPATLSDLWQKVRDDATATTPITVIINPASGPLNPASGGADYTNYLYALSQLRDNPFIRILGYIPTGFGTLPAATVLGALAQYEAGYKHISNGSSLIDGIFLDEMSNSTTHLPIYNAIATGIRASSELAAKMIAGNPGTSIPVEYLDANTADLFVVREGELNDLLSNPLPAYVTMPAYNHLAFAAIIHTADGGESAQALRAMKLGGLNFGFTTDDTLPNPFDATPVYWDAQLENIHSPAVDSAALSVAENSTVGTVVGSVVAVEPDSGQTLTFSIVSGNAGGAFAIDSVTGEITVANAGLLDFESTPSFTLTVEAVDNGVPVLSDSNTVTISLIDQAEFAMTFVGGVLSITGTPIDDELRVTQSGGNYHVWDRLVDVDTGIAVASVTRVELRGGNGNDFLSRATDTKPGSILGEEGNDVIEASPMNDSIVGGNGVDTLSYQYASSGVSVNLALLSAQITGGSGTDTIATIENLTGSNFNDTLRGSSGSNVLQGLDGVNQLFGNSGNDTYLYNNSLPLGDDTLNDTSGVDTISFEGSTLGVVFSLGLLTPQVNTHIGSLPFSITLTSATAFENVVGSDGDDILFGGTGVNLLEGKGGNDELRGGSGNDTYQYNADIATGSDTIFDEVGVDTVSFAPSTVGVVFDIGLILSQAASGLSNIQLATAATVDNVTGGTGNDQLTGNSLANILVGGAGDDSLQGLAGNDTYSYDADLELGTDTIADSAGIDVLNFALTTTQSVSVNLGTTTSQVVNSNLSLVLASGAALESVVGGALGDVIVGNSLANNLNGGLGNDQLDGQGGIDTLTGAAGNDQLQGGLGNDIFVFDADSQIGVDSIEDAGGVDLLNFATTTLNALQLDLALTSVQTVNSNLGLQFVVADQIENVTGGSLSDVIMGNTLANTLNGGIGDDQLDGRDGADILIGGAGLDALEGGNGDDRFQFDADAPLGVDTITDPSGMDLLDFSLTTTVAVNVDLQSVGAAVINANLSLLLPASGIESVLGTRLDDTLRGNGAANILLGGLGNDIIDGRGGRDLLIGGAGLDSLVGGDDDDLLIAGTSTHEASIANLNIVLGEWTSANSYNTRITNLRAGVSGVALIAKTTVKKDTGADSLQGGLQEDWFFAATDDAITDLAIGEIVDLL